MTTVVRYENYGIGSFFALKMNIFLGVFLFTRLKDGQTESIYLLNQAYTLESCTDEYALFEKGNLI